MNRYEVNIFKMKVITYNIFEFFKGKISKDLIYRDVRSLFMQRLTSKEIINDLKRRYSSGNDV